MFALQIVIYKKSRVGILFFYIHSLRRKLLKVSFEFVYWLNQYGDSVEQFAPQTMICKKSE